MSGDDCAIGSRRALVSRWNEALAAFDEAEAVFSAANAVYRRIERGYFAARREGSESDDKTLRAATGLDKADAEEKQAGDRLYDITRTLLATPAPDLAAAIRKLELIFAAGPDDECERWLLADLRRLDAERRAS